MINKLYENTIFYTSKLSFEYQPPKNHIYYFEYCPFVIYA